MLVRCQRDDDGFPFSFERGESRTRSRHYLARRKPLYRCFTLPSLGRHSIVLFKRLWEVIFHTRGQRFELYFAGVVIVLLGIHGLVGLFVIAKTLCK
jgi:hypothetical protein